VKIELFGSVKKPQERMHRPNSLSITGRYPVNMNILGLIMLALQWAPRHNMAILSKISQTILIKFQ
jgi:hypothetical protein